MKSYCKATIYGPTPGPKHSKLEEFSKNELHLIRHVPVSNFHAAVNWWAFITVYGIITIF